MEAKRKRLEESIQGLPVQIDLRYIRDHGQLIVAVVDRLTGRVIKEVPVDRALQDLAGFRALVTGWIERMGE